MRPDWKHISEAKKDGTEYLIAIPSFSGTIKYQRFGWWSKKIDCWVYEDEGGYESPFYPYVFAEIPPDKVPEELLRKCYPERYEAKEAGL